jgi:hypothetical protein
MARPDPLRVELPAAILDEDALMRRIRRWRRGRVRRSPLPFAVAAIARAYSENPPVVNWVSTQGHPLKT